MKTEKTDDIFKNFSFDRSGGNLLKFGFAISVVVSIGLAAAYRGQFDRTVFMMVWFGCWVCLIFATYFVLISADVCINNSQIARGLNGHLSQRIAWDNVRLIRQFSAYVPAEKESRRFLQIFPTKSSFWKFQMLGSMLVSDRLDDYEELITVLSDHLSNHPAKFEVKVDGRWERRQRLLPLTRVYKSVGIGC
jgi:hypothetical protein